MVWMVGGGGGVVVYESGFVSVPGSLLWIFLCCCLLMPGKIRIRGRCRSRIRTSPRCSSNPIASMCRV